jgi:hypothetical protein
MLKQPILQQGTILRPIKSKVVAIGLPENVSIRRCFTKEVGFPAKTFYNSIITLQDNGIVEIQKWKKTRLGKWEK